jgi:hypothetical protein
MKIKDLDGRKKDMFMPSDCHAFNYSVSRDSNI